jgi:hypothetical protein
MFENIIDKDAERILSNVSPDFYFRVKDNTIVKNLHELYDVLNNIDEESFKHHANEERNDFSNWVRDIHKDEKLANTLIKCKTKEEMAENIKKRIIYLDRIKNNKLNSFEVLWRDLLKILRLR